jgi:hypothetical protein
MGHLGEGVGDSSTTSRSTIEAQKDVEREWGRASYIPSIRPLSDKIDVSLSSLSPTVS